MSVVDFNEWAIADLEIPLKGRTYTVRPPTVEASKKLIAAAIRGEVNLGLVIGEIPPEIQAVLDTIEPGEHPALGEVYEQMHRDGLDPVTIDRVAYYAVFYWSRGKEYADSLAAILWTPRTNAEQRSGEPAPKG